MRRQARSCNGHSVNRGADSPSRANSSWAPESCATDPIILAPKKGQVVSFRTRCTRTTSLAPSACVVPVRAPSLGRQRPIDASFDNRLESAIDPLQTLADGVSLPGMTHREPDAPSSIGPLRTASWALVTMGAAFLLFTTWHQRLMALDDMRYGIEVPWLSQLLWLLAFAGLEAGAIWTARRKLYGVSIAFSSFLVALLGLFALFAIAQIGM